MEPTDAELVRRALLRDERACQRLYRRHVGAVRSLACRLCPREVDGEDVAQDAFACAFAGLGHLRNPEAFGAWVRAIVVRTSSKRLRRARVARRIGLSHTHPHDVEALADNEWASAESAIEVRRLGAQLREMSGDVGLALVLKRVEGMTLAEVASRLGVSVPTVKRRIKHAEAGLIEARGGVA